MQLNLVASLVFSAPHDTAPHDIHHFSMCTNSDHVHSHSKRSGIIIDGFGELRDKENEAKEYREETCVVCGVNRQAMDQVRMCTLCLISRITHSSSKDASEMWWAVHVLESI